MRIGPVRFSLLILASLALAACGQSEGEHAAQGPLKAGYITVKAQPYTFTTELPGRTTPYQIAEVRPQVTGLIEKRLFKEGVEVKAGDPLYQIDNKLYRAAVESAQADLASAAANQKVANLKAERYAKLVKRKMISEQDYDQARANLGQANAAVAAAQAALDTAKINLGYTTIRAPISGRIGRSNVTAGALVTANQASSLATIRRLDPIYVDLSQSYQNLTALREAMRSGQLEKVGQDKARVTLVMKDGSQYGLDGTLQFSEYSVDPSTGAVSLRALFPNPNGDLLPGMFVRARLPQGTNKNAILVPQKAITIEPNGSASALVVGPDNKVQSRTVTTEQAVDGQWLISKGLKPGDKLIVDNLQKLRPGMPVNPVPADQNQAGSDNGNGAA